MTTVAMIEHMMTQVLNLREAFMRCYKEVQEAKLIQHLTTRKLKPRRSGEDSKRHEHLRLDRQHVTCLN